MQERRSPPTAQVTTHGWPSFQAFDSTAELWTDYANRFNTWFDAHSIPTDKWAQVFLTNQSAVVYKLLQNLGAQQTPPRTMKEMTRPEIEAHMREQYDPRQFIVRKRFRFWSKMDRKPGESIQELATRIWQDAATCDFASIRDPQDEALRTRFICSVSNEAVLKALFKEKDDKLTFIRAIEIATETEEAVKVARDGLWSWRTAKTDQQDQRKVI